MIAVSIAALSLALSAVVSPSTEPSAAPSHTPNLESHLPSLPSLKMPHIPKPKIRLPHLPKRSGSNELMAQTARRLKSLVSDQESWYADHGRYGSNSFAVARSNTRSDSTFEQVQVQVLFAGAKGWSAMASHPDAPGKSCVIYVGNRTALPVIPRTRAEAVDATAEAKPACDK